MVAEDGSPQQVAGLLCTLYTQCAAGDTVLAQQVLAQPIATSQQCVAAPDTAEMDGDEESDDEMEEAPPTLTPMAPISEGSGGSGGGAAAAAVDDDGWTSVTRSGRRFGAS